MHPCNEKRAPMMLTPAPSPARRRPLAALLLALAVLTAPALAAAAEITWFAQNGSWSNPANWWPNVLPAQGDLVWVKANAGDVIWVGYASTTGPQLATVHFDSVGSGVAIVGLSHDLLHVGQHNVGLTGHAIMAASGGTHQVGDLNLGFWSGAHGEYNLNPGGTLVANRVFVGVGGVGDLTQTGGSASIAGELSVGFLSGSVGTYDVSGASQLSAAKLLVGNGGRGTLWHSEAALSIPVEVTLGLFASGNGRYELRGGGSISTGKVNVGAGGRGVLVQEGGDVDVAGDIVLGLLAGANGTWDISGPATVASQKLFVAGGGVGRVVQQDGDVSVRGDLVVGNLGGTDGTYELVGGTLGATRAYVGSFGRGLVEQTGGAVDIAGLMQIGIWGTGRGSYLLAGDGTLEVGTLVLGGFGIGHFEQSGGTFTAWNDVRVGELANSRSTLTVSGGDFEAPRVWNKVDGGLVYTGGSLAALALVNDGAFDLEGEGERVVEGSVTNNGRVETFETTAVFTGAFAHRGQYVSTQSTNAFGDMTVTGGGTVVADAGSRFTFAGDLRLDSPGTGWDTSLARLEFVPGGDGTHRLRHAGQDFGASEDGFVDNFAWHALRLDEGQSLVLEGGDLYVRVLELVGGLPQLASIGTDGHDIYYDGAEPTNAYLGGETYALGGGGEAIPVPEPGGVVGLAAGVGLLAGLRRRGRAR